MKEDAPRVIKIPAKPEATRQAEACRQLRVAAYCRVSTKEEDQANSYEVQKEYYTDKIMSNTAWTMAGIFADKGITGTSAKKREDFMRMIRHCRQKKIDVILTKSVSRFSRNTVDCLYYIRALKQLGIAVIFEKENINSLEEDSELRITLSGAFAQSESESISANVTWGKRRAMEAGKVSIQYKKLYGYRKGEDGQPEIIPEQAEIVRWLYERYLTGASLRMIKDELEQQGVKCPTTGTATVGVTRVGNGVYAPHVGLVIENVFLYECLSGRQNLQMLNDLSDHKISDGELDGWLTRFGLDPADRRPMKKYSLGMCQKVSLIQALMNQPELVLLDEPTNALDDASVQVLEAEILRMNREAGTTFLIASHDRATLEHLCTKILRMEAGHLA